ncbi:MAG: HRDC domain-containing protein [Anaerolineae bacterium]|nr:HRDC domain-containing protein [Anaerolineae bacterium]NUQ05752.1 HRDC domain-containing protein [Anaerolineae bacterium]
MKTPPKSGLPAPLYVDSDVKLLAAVALMQREPALALDTESNSLHAYQERVCLIQVSTGKEDYIIDPLAIKDLRPIGALLEDPRIEKVFHAAEYDLICLRRDHGFQVNNLFDTMIAARVCGFKETGLGSLVRQFFDVSMDKSHQRDDWGRRPLARGSLIYAQMDTHYLLPLRDHLAAALQHSGREEEALEWFREASQLPPARPRQYDGSHSFWRLALPNHLTPEQSAVLKAVYNLRENIARKRDVPPFKIISDQALVAIARAMPTRMSDLRRLHGVAQSYIDRFGEPLLSAVREGLASASPTPPPPDPPADPLVVERYTALREWRKAKAAQREVEADVIVSKDALWSLAEIVPESLDSLGEVRGFGPWRRAAYGEEILGVLRRWAKPR